MRLGEGFVKVEVDDVEAHVARAREAHHRVEVGAVVVERGADAAHDARDLGDVAVEQPERVGVGEHQARRALVDLGAQVVDVDAAVGGRAHRHRFVTGHRHRRRVGAMGGVGDQHLGTLLPALLVVGARHQEAAQLSLRAGTRVEGYVGQARDLGERPLEAPH